jgi:hypothetical protein
MWPRRESALDRETVDGIISKLMEIDSKLNRILRRLDIDEQEADDA